MIESKTYHSPWRLRAIWERLYADGHYTPFQSWICNWWYYLTYGLKGSRRKYTPQFVLMTRDADMCILPIAVDRKRKKVIDFSVGGPIDYYDALSSTRDAEFLSACVERLREMYTGYEIVLSNVNEQSLLCQVLPQENVIETEPCVKIDFESEEYDEYYQSLSKHQRQNLRTGYNKLLREGLSWRLERYDTKQPMSQSDWKKCLKMYEERSRMKNKRGNSLSLRIADWKNRQINLINILVRRWDRAETFVLYLDGEPVAYMSGMYNEQHDTYYVPRLSCSNQYLKYDTGILMLNESIKILLKEGIKTVDLTRGDEPYKFAMGGKESLNYGYRI